MEHTASPTLRSLSFALLFVSSVALAPVARAATPSTPVDYPDAAHVPNGCYLSSLTYIRKFSEAYQNEHARTLSFAPRGWGGGHFVALVTWQGEWWIRDEYFGVFPVGLKADSKVNPAQLDLRAAATFDKYTKEYLRTRYAPILPWNPRKLTEVQKADSVSVAATLIPYKTGHFRVKCGAKEISFLFFRPAEGQIAVYEPSHGTAVAMCAGSDASEIVAAVATKLGYKVASVRTAFPIPTIVVAAN